MRGNAIFIFVHFIGVFIIQGYILSGPDCKYIQDYEKFEGIKLNQNNICVNEGLRSISKFLLNSTWDRHCLQTNKIKYAMVSSLKEL